MPAGNEPGARLESEARLLLLTAEIERLRSLGPDDHVRAALGLKIDEAAQLMERIGLLDDGVPYWTAFLRIGSDEPGDAR
jgi:hypothetical protein